MTVTVTPTVEPSTSNTTPPRVRLDITDDGGLAQTTITRLDPDGSSVVVRTGDGGPLPISAGIGLLYDYEAPFGAQVSYASLESPAVTSIQVTVDEAQVWLIHPGVPTLSRPVRAAGISGRIRPVRRGVHYPMGRKHAVVQTDGQRKAPEYTLTVRTTTEDERLAIDTLLEDASVLLLNVPADKGWGITAEYVAVGDSDEGRLFQYAREPRRHWTLPLLVVDRPAGGTTAARTYQDLLVGFATYADLAATHPTYYDVLVGQ